jgi:NitT/TauT family transport system substrate-binding protein
MGTERATAHVVRPLRQRAAATAGALLTALLVLVGCGAPAAGAAPAAPPKPPAGAAAPSGAPPAPASAPAATAPTERLPLTVAYSSLVASQSPSWIAKEAGVYDRYGLDVNLVYISSAQQNVAALLAGETDVAISGGTGIITPTLQGADIVTFAGTKNQLAGRIMARPEIQSVTDLKGKRVGVTRLGGNSHYMGIVALQKYGMSPDRDVIFIGAGGTPEIVGALTAGSLDAGVIVTPGDYVAEKRGFKPILDMTPMAIPYPATQGTARRALLASKEEAIWRYTQALADAVQLYKDDRELALRIIGDYTRMDDREALETGYEVERAIMASDLRPDLTAVQAVIDEAAQDEPRAKDTRPEDYVDFRFVDRLAATRR